MKLKQYLEPALKITQVGLKQLQEAPDGNLVDNAQIVENRSYDTPFLDEKVQLELNAKGDFSVVIFNNVDDLSTEIEKQDLYLTKDLLSSLVDQKALIKYQMNAHLKGKGSFSVEQLGFQVEGSRNMSLRLYKTHSITEKIGPSIWNDLEDFKVVFEENFWKSLDENDACSFSFGGDLQGEVQVDIVSVLGGIIAPFATLLGSNNLINIVFDPSIKLKFGFEIRDQFSLLVSKESDDWYQLNLSKELEKSASLGIEAQIKASLAESEFKKIQKVLDDTLEKIFQADSSTIEQIINQPDSYVDSLVDGSKHSQIIRSLQQLLVDGEKAPLSTLKDYYFEFTEKVQGVYKEIKDVSNYKLETTISYEYKRTVKESTLLHVKLKEEVLAEHHKNILTVNLNDLKKTIQEELKKGSNSKVELLSYFGQKEINVEKSWTFGITLGKWAVFKSSNITKYGYLYKTDIQDRQQISFSSSKERLKGVKNQKNVFLSFDANTKDYLLKPSYDQLNYTFTVEWEAVENSIKNKAKDQKLLYDFLQIGLCWGIIPQDKLESVYSEIWDDILGDQAVQFEAVFHIPDQIFKEALPYFYKYASDRSFLAGIFAACMPYNDERGLESTKDITMKKNFFYPVFMYYLSQTDDPSYSNPTFNQIILKGLSSIPESLQKTYKSLFNYERQKAAISYNGASGESLMGVLKHSGLIKLSKDFKEGMALLQHAIVSHQEFHGGKDEVLLEVFKEWKNLLNTHQAVKDYHQKWMGSYFYHAIKMENPTLLKSMESYLKISFQDENGDTKSKVIKMATA